MRIQKLKMVSFVLALGLIVTEFSGINQMYAAEIDEPFFEDENLIEIEIPLFSSAEKNKYIENFTNQYNQLMGYLNPYFEFGITLSMNREMSLKQGFDEIENNRANYDLILSAHLHHFSADEKNETILISNASLMGTDDYAQSLRLNSKPSQNLIILGEDNPLECIYNIPLPRYK